MTTPRSGGLGQVLLWYSANPRDPRRGPILAACLLDFIAAVTDSDQPIPHPDFTPSARFPTLSPRARLLQNLRDIASGALVTGVVVSSDKSYESDGELSSFGHPPIAQNP